MGDKSAQSAEVLEPLPPVTVGRFKEGTALLEQQLEENTDLFISKMQAYREKHRAGSSRPLTAVETAQIAAGLGRSLQEAAVEIDEAGLKHYDEPDAKEVLLAAGLSTPTAFLNVGLRLYALLAMPGPEFKEARKEGRLGVVLDAAVAELDEEEIQVVRGRAWAAYEHLAAASGVEPGKAVGTVMRTVWTALMAAADQAATTPSASLIGSAEPTADSPSTTSSTS